MRSSSSLEIVSGAIDHFWAEQRRKCIPRITKLWNFIFWFYQIYNNRLWSHNASRLALHFSNFLVDFTGRTDDEPLRHEKNSKNCVFLEFIQEKGNVAVRGEKNRRQSKHMINEGSSSQRSSVSNERPHQNQLMNVEIWEGVKLTLLGL